MQRVSAQGAWRVDTSPGASVVIRPMGVGEVVDTGIRLARRHWRPLALAAAWAYVPLYLFLAIVTVLVQIITQNPTAAAGFVSVFGFVAGILGLLGPLAMIVGCARVVEAPPGTDLRAELRPGALYRTAWSRLGATLLLGIIFFFAAFLVLLPPLGIYLFVRWSVGIVALVVEQRGPFSSLGRSWNLTRGSWWHTFGVFVVFFLLILALTGIIGGFVAALAVLLAIVVGPLAGQLVTYVVDVVGGIVFTPFEMGILVTLYFELRARREGTDLRFGTNN